VNEVIYGKPFAKEYSMSSIFYYYYCLRCYYDNDDDVLLNLKPSLKDLHLKNIAARVEDHPI
jgi:hypothetical protein